MQYLMLTYSSEEGAAHYEAQTAQEQATDRQRHTDWFEEHSAAIRGGHELSWPRIAGTIVEMGKPKVLDGPFVESKEMLGGVIILEAPSLQAALDIGATWPSLEIYPGSRVDVIAAASD